jgi:hypothetical protein
MREKKPAKPETDKYSLRRLERLADTIFAIALMVLIVKIEFAPRDLASAAVAYKFLFKSSSQTLFPAGVVLLDQPPNVLLLL